MKNQIAFSVSAGAYIYQMGIGCYLQRHYDLSNCYFSGASGGAWVALLLAAGKDIKVAFDIMVQTAHRLFDGRLLGSYLIYDRAIEESFHMIFNGEDVPSLINGRLSIIITRLSWSGRELFKQETIDHWTSNDDVLQCVIASALIPFALNGKPFVQYRGWHCLDGGVTNIEGINQAWALAHHRTTSLMQASSETCLRSIEDLMNGEESMPLLTHTDASANQMVVSSTSTVWVAVRWIPFANYMVNFLEPKTVDTQADAVDTIPVKPPTHLVRFVGKIAKVAVNAVVEQVTYPVHATIRTATEIQRKTWQLTTQVYQTTEGVAVQLHEVLPLKGVRDQLLSFVVPSSSVRVTSHSTPITAVSSADAESITDDPENVAATQLLHDRIRQAIETTMIPWQLGRAASQSLTNKLKMIAQQVTNNMFDLLATPGFSLEDQYGENVDRPLEGVDELLDIEAAASVSDPATETKPVMLSRADSAIPSTQGRRVSTIRRAASDSMVNQSATLQLVAKDGHSFDHTAFWGENNREFVIKQLPNGAKRLELAPWSWRKHDIQTYHLSADLNINRKLFALGILDAETHHWEMHEFFT